MIFILLTFFLHSFLSITPFVFFSFFFFWGSCQQVLALLIETPLRLLWHFLMLLLGALIWPFTVCLRPCWTQVVPAAHAIGIAFCDDRHSTRI